MKNVINILFNIVHVTINKNIILLVTLYHCEMFSYFGGKKKFQMSGNKMLRKSYGHEGLEGITQ